LTGSENPLPSMKNLERFEDGRFLLRRRSLIDAILHVTFHFSGFFQVLAILNANPIHSNGPSSVPSWRPRQWMRRKRP